MVDGFGEFGFPVLPRQELLFVEPDKKAFVLELFDDILGDPTIG